MSPTTKAKEAENKHEIDNLTANNTMNTFQLVGKLKYNNLFNTHADTHTQRVGYIISVLYITINVFLHFFLFFRLSLN